MNFIDKDFALHERALRFRSQRMEVLSSNIANADTPNFKARDIDFRQVMKTVRTDALTTTQPQHYELEGGVPPDQAALKYRIPFNTSFDGNTVELSMEQAKFGKATGDFQATLSFLENRVSGIRKALKGE
ncbi:MAG: flagellar basal body rod protein FlgB [Betaproteobacteria bacterium]|jgi:flagellar basal-body rod protein FlgB|nr:flagellar basal body rod protein FlgB [Betaproteobacteria bacterium]